MLLINVPKNLDSEEKLRLYKENYLKLSNALNDLEKDYNVSGIRARLLEFEPLVKLVRIKYEKEVINRIERLLVESFDELQELCEGNDFDKTLKLINFCYNELNKKNYKKAIKLYEELNLYYKNLSKELQKLIYKACLDINEKIKDKQ
jgi:hypothetical protein